jgi:hypothetical protein
MKLRERVAMSWYVTGYQLFEIELFLPANEKYSGSIELTANSASILNAQQ